MSPDRGDASEPISHNGGLTPGSRSSIARQGANRAIKLSIPRRLSIFARWAVPLRWRLGLIALLGGLAAATVGYLTAQNPDPAPAGVAVPLRVLTIVVLIAAGVWAQTAGSQARMGRLLVGAGFASCFWLLQGSSSPLLFSIGELCAGLATVGFTYLMLAHPTGRLRSRAQRRFIRTAGGVCAGCWMLAVLTSAQPPFTTPLIRCAPHCPTNRLFLGFTTGAGPVLNVLIGLSWVLLAAGAVLVLIRRMRSASPPARRMIAPVLIAGTSFLLSSGGFLVAKSAAPHLSESFGVVTITTAILVPLGIVLGLISERLSMGQALQGFVNELGAEVPLDVEARMGAYLHDPSLRIAYPRPILGTYVDAAGAPMTMPAADDIHRAATEIRRADHPVALVIHDAEMADQRRYVKAAGTAAMMWLQNAQLQADLNASVIELANSRSRLVETADNERRRIERDLHDGVQQHLIGTQLTLQLVTEAFQGNPKRAKKMLDEIREQVDDALEQLRALARGIYPPLLEEHGLGDAIKSVAQRSAIAVSVRTHGIGRYRTDVETAVYFCCLEALQNAAKHAGRGALVTVHLWEQGGRLCLEVSDTGVGFTTGTPRSGMGLISMRDRLAAAGGTLTVVSTDGRGTTIRGVVPLA